ncbi:APC1 [Malassezia furfur]|nr:APC1 [Malassezia furfur]
MDDAETGSLAAQDARNPPAERPAAEGSATEGSAKGPAAKGPPTENPTAESPPGPPPPPDLYTLVQDTLRTPTSLDAVYTACAASLGVAPVAPVAPHMPWLAALLAVYAALRPAASATGVAAAQPVVEAMLAVHWDAETLARLPPGLALPLHEALRTCQLDPPPAWPPAAYALVRRLDASAQAGGAHTTGRVRVAPSLLRTLPDGLDPLSAQLFAHDYRLAEVARMLQTTHANVAYVAPDDERDEAEHHAELVHTARTLAERTMAQCVGRGRVPHGVARRACDGDVAHAAAQRRAACAARRRGRRASVCRGPARGRVARVPQRACLCAGDALHADDRLDSSWIFSHSTAPRDAARHAGFLLGLGLQGHLARLGRVHAYRYLAPRHALTTVGLVLGVAASFRGTADPAARQVMAVQAAAFLPARGAALHLPALTQAAGVLGMGLVFAGTDHRWTAERLAAQLDAPLAAPDAAHAHDLYANAAGLALGFVLLGRGRRTPMDAASDAALVARLRRLVGAHGPEAPAANRTAHAAALALALIFLRSGRADVARLVAPPPSRAALAHTRPDLLLVRAVAHALIHWDAIAPDDAWLLSTLPPFLQTLAPHTALAPAERVAWYNVRAGACLALALRFAGTADARARALLLRQLRAHVDDAAPPGAPATYAARIVHAARETLRDVLHVRVRARAGDCAGDATSSAALRRVRTATSSCCASSAAHARCSALR